MTKNLQNHTLTATSLTHLARLWCEYGVSPCRYPRMASLVLSGTLSWPLRVVDQLRSARAVRGAPIKDAPIFIIGHPRSGTTHLHNLLSRDPRFGCATTFHCAAAEMFLGLRPLVRWSMRRMLPEARPMDDVKVGLDEPQEEEMAMARISPLSFNHGLHFPRSARDVFHRSVTFESGNPEHERRWKRDYHWFLKRVSIDQSGRRLCLKSPPNMARIPQLLDLFPGARFIHIYRNPYLVYRSVVALWTKVLPMLALQRYEFDQVERDLVYFYQRMMERFFADQSGVPAGQLAEVRFEDLEADPLGELRRVYETLRLEGFDVVRPIWDEYLKSLSGYQKNRYSWDEQTLLRVEEAWGSTLTRWSYARPE